MSLLKTFKQRIHPFTSHYLSNAVLAEGILKGTSLPFRCLFLENSIYKGYIFARLYDRSPLVLKNWKIFIPDLKRVIKKYSSTFDICMAVVPNDYESSLTDLYAFRGQAFVHQVIDTSGTWEEIVRNFHQKKRQISNNVVCRFRLNYQISHNIDDFDLFYYRMYLPHIKNQFNLFADVDSYEDMREYFLNGFLLLVTSNGFKVAGALCLVEHNSLIFRRSGVLDADEKYRKQGAQLALYLFNIRYAWEHGLKQVDTMKSRPFLNDGVYRTKREWGAIVYPDYEADSSVYYFIPRYSPQISAFFEHNPTVIETQKGLSGLIGCRDSIDYNSIDHNELLKKYKSPGINSLLLLRNGCMEELLLDTN